MKRFVISLAAAGVLAALLSACGGIIGPARLQFSTSPGSLGYEVDDTGKITIGERSMTFRNSSGAYAVTLTSYRITFRDAAGALVNGGDAVAVGSLNLYVPAGIQCAVPDAVTGCTLESEGATFGPGPIVTTVGYQLLPASIATANLAAGFPVGWYADIEFTGTDGAGLAFTTTPYKLGIAPPD